jgi:hypothetical protein
VHRPRWEGHRVAEPLHCRDPPEMVHEPCHHAVYQDLSYGAHLYPAAELEQS